MVLIKPEEAMLEDPFLIYVDFDKYFSWYSPLKADRLKQPIIRPMIIVDAYR